MTRIAGITHPNARALLPQWRPVLAEQWRCAEGDIDIWQGEGAGLAVQRGKGGSLAQLQGLSAAVDGFFYNADELPGGSAESAAVQLIHLYRQYGCEAALQRINGDFAFALYDAEQGKNWIGRDRVGHHPLYYSTGGTGFVFASRPQALRSFAWARGGANARFSAVFAGSHYRYIDNRPEESPFEAIRQVPPAHAIELNAGKAGVARRYWDLSEQPEWEEGEERLSERYRDLLVDAVRRRLAISNAPAFTLSGGMDSSSVLSCATLVTGQRQYAYSSVYSDKTYDESDDIKGFVADKVAEWRQVHIEGFDLFDVVRRMVRAHDEPVATATWLSHYLLCDRVAADRHDVLFGGLGGDELNAGEYEYFIFHFADLLRQGRNAELEHEIEKWALHHDHPIYRKNRQVALELVGKLTDPAQAGFIQTERQRLTRYYPAVKREYHDLASFEPILDHRFSFSLKNRTYQDIFRETAPCCLRAEDRDCSAHHLAHVDPFFDHRLIEFMFRVPGSMKIRDGVTKRLLREAMKGILPEETRTRIKKTGWNAPAHIWFSGEALVQTRDLVNSQAFRQRGIYDPAVVQGLLDEHVAIVSSGKPMENHMMFLWQMINLELWFQEVVDRPPPLISG
ncbi:MAG: asparagine synthetase B family protein [Ferrovibrio sp.]|uniref:asparagine synthetase B family protein n=1 Tax=Ferrovibrio sp. TaxID=1917215 RepID=UPI00391DBC43